MPRPFASGRAARVAVTALLGVAQAVFLGVMAFATRDAFVAIYAGSAPGWSVLATLAGAGIAAAACDGVARICAESLGQRYASAMRVALYGHFAGMSRRALDTRRLGALSLRFVGDLSALRNWFGRGLPRAVSAAMVLPSVTLVVFLLDPALGLAAALPLGASLCVMGVAAIGLKPRHRRLRSGRAKIAIMAMERLIAAPRLDLIGRSASELKSLEKSGVNLRRTAVARERRITLLRLIPQMGAAISAIAVLATAGQNGLATGAAAAALSMLAILTMPLRELAEAWDQFCAWDIAREKLQIVFEKPSRRRRTQALGAPAAVSIKTPQRQYDIPAGELAQIDGPMGGGKSALANAIAGLDHDPDLTIRYRDAAGGRVRGRLPKISHIGDQLVVLRGSLRRVLTLGQRPRPPDEAIENMARRFGLSEMIGALEGGLMGRIETAQTLSSGEGLRICLTRAALAQPDLIILDNAQFRADPNAALLLDDLRQNTNATVIIVGPTHGLPEPDIRVPTYCDPVA